MDQINVLVIEDTPSERNALLSALSDSQFNVVGVATTHQEALELFFANKVDLLIIDVFLNGAPDGITFAETINVLPDAARPFVFLTSSTDRAIFERAKLTKPYSFLLKPFNPLEILYALEMAIEKFYDQSDVFQSDEENTVISSEYFFIKKNNSLKKVAVSDIVHIGVEERYCTIFTEVDKFLIQISLTKIIELLDATKFCRTHRNHIVNLEQIEEIQTADNLLVMSNKQLIPISSNYKDLLLQFKILK